jgi:predicted nucleotidyltransferase
MNSITFGTRPGSTSITAIDVLSSQGAEWTNCGSIDLAILRPRLLSRAGHCFFGLNSFVRAARLCPGVRRIGLLGSVATAKAIPKDVDLLVTIERTMDLSQLARAGRRLKGLAQTINLGADIFLADTAGHYLGRICHYRECHPRVACRAQHCGLREHLNHDLDVVTLSKDLLASPPVELWPKVVRSLTIPTDVEEILLTKLEQDQYRSTTRRSNPL